VCANACLGTTATVRGQMAHFLDGLEGRITEVRPRCRTKLPTLAETTTPLPRASIAEDTQVGCTCASVQGVRFLQQERKTSKKAALCFAQEIG